MNANIVDFSFRCRVHWHNRIIFATKSVLVPDSSSEHHDNSVLVLQRLWIANLATTSFDHLTCMSFESLGHCL